jgi:hypothetical protein
MPLLLQSATGEILTPGPFDLPAVASDGVLTVTQFALAFASAKADDSGGSSGRR